MEDYKKLLRSAFDSYLEKLDDLLEPSISFLPYEFTFITERHWSLLGKEMVIDEIRELTNILNHWLIYLHRWHAWNITIEAYPEEKRWELQKYFLEALVHHCLLFPSSMRDTFTFVATNSFHQARLACDNEYKDYLEGDPKAANEKPIHLIRRKKESRLKKLLAYWAHSNDFIDLIQLLNDETYQHSTSNYRNRVNHTIGPRLGLGITQTVTRSIIPATQLVQQDDGTYAEALILDKVSVSYGYGGTKPLDFEKSRLINLEQFKLARRCYDSYMSLLKIATQKLPNESNNA